MTAQTPVGSGNRVRASIASERLPPEEQFWLRYSPHHEFPLSSATSVALHVLVLVFLGLAAWVAIRLGLGYENKPPSVSAVSLDAGGGGRKDGKPGGVFGGGAALPDDVQMQDPQPALDPNALNRDLKEKVGPAPPVDLQFDKKGRAMPLVGKDTIRLLEGLAADQGQKGPGIGGGQGGGNGPGIGGGDGRGKAPNERQRRVLRWSMKFSTQSGNDYLQQLRDIKPGGGAILAVPAGEGRFEVFRDLSRQPATGKVEDLRTMNRIFWIDDQPESVRNLARAMGIKSPSSIYAFFPVELENELVRLERVKSGGAKEDDIDETQFEVVRDSNGYRAKCVSVHIKGR
jgi:hypothetical protein